MSHRPHCDYPRTSICMCEMELEDDNVQTNVSKARHDRLCPMWIERCYRREQSGSIIVIQPQEHPQVTGRKCPQCGEECWCELIRVVRKDERKAMDKEKAEPGRHSRPRDESVVYGNPQTTWRPSSA